MQNQSSAPSSDLRVPTDTMTDEQLKRYLSSWISSQTPEAPSADVLDQYAHLISPRSVFLKNVPPSANVLDLGAGDGGLSIYKTWPPFMVRQDIKLYGLSLEWAEQFSRYEKVEIGNFETQNLSFGGTKFDAVLCSHFIEHISDLQIVFKYLEGKLAPAARVYFEWPHPISKRLPSRDFFLDQGLPVTTTNFFDDHTHNETWDMRNVIENIEQRGFVLESMGRTHFPFLADCLKDRAKVSGDMSTGTFAVWYKTGWAQYVVWSRPSPVA